MKNVQKPDHLTLGALISRLDSGRYEIPDFQREFEWNPSDIRELMRSIFLDYYIGSLLLWKGTPDNFNALACEPLYGFEGESEPTHIVLDGQQRLTAMYYTFVAPDKSAPSRKNRYLYFIRVDKFIQEDFDEAFCYDWTRSGIKLLSDKTAQFDKHMFPLSVMKKTWDTVAWCHGYKEHWLSKKKDAQFANSGENNEFNIASQHAMNAQTFEEHLEGIIQDYRVTYIELDQDLPLEKICDIFTQINSRGIRLDIFDLMNALLRPKGIQLKHLWRNAKPNLDFIETDRINIYILQVMSILCQNYCSPKYLYYLLPGQEKKVLEHGSLQKKILIRNSEVFEERWHEAVNALKSAIILLRDPREFGAISYRYLPYSSILPVFAAVLFSDQSSSALSKIRRWYWASVFTNRYSGSVESTIARDFVDLKKWFKDDAAQPTFITDFNHEIIDLHRETKRGTSIYNGIFNLLILNGARDWMQGTAFQNEDLDDHHIVPKNWEKGYDLVTPIDTILNRTPLTSDTNRRIIRDCLPNKYLPDWIKQYGESIVRNILSAHFISSKAFSILLRDPFTPDDYEEFLDDRRRMIMNGLENLLITEPTGPNT